MSISQEITPLVEQLFSLPAWPDTCTICTLPCPSQRRGPTDSWQGRLNSHLSINPPNHPDQPTDQANRNPRGGVTNPKVIRNIFPRYSEKESNNFIRCGTMVLLSTIGERKRAPGAEKLIPTNLVMPSQVPEGNFRRKSRTCYLSFQKQCSNQGSEYQLVVQSTPRCCTVFLRGTEVRQYHWSEVR